MVMLVFPQCRRTNPCGADGQAAQQRERDDRLFSAGLGSRDWEKRCRFGMNWAEDISAHSRCDSVCVKAP